MATQLIDMRVVSQLLRLPYRHVWSDYDADADVLYLSFRKPQGANDTLLESDGNLYHYRDEQLVGVTILNASKKASARTANGRKEKS